MNFDPTKPIRLNKNNYEKVKDPKIKELYMIMIPYTIISITLIIFLMILHDNSIQKERAENDKFISENKITRIEIENEIERIKKENFKKKLEEIALLEIKKRERDNR